MGCWFDATSLGPLVQHFETYGTRANSTSEQLPNLLGGNVGNSTHPEFALLPSSGLQPTSSSRSLGRRS
jgi:hypothetical protein